MKIGMRIQDEIAILALEGRLTIGDGDAALRQDIEDLVKEGRKKVLIDLKGVRAMDSSGLGELVRARDVAERAGCSIKLLHVEDKVASVLEVTRLIGVFEIFEDEALALASFS